MALKALMLRKKLDQKNKELEAARAKKEELQKREAELEAAVAEVTEETSEEDKASVTEEVEKFDQEKAEADAEEKRLVDEIAETEAELKDAEARQNKEPEKTPEKREVRTMIQTRFTKMGIQEREAFFAREDVKSFVEEVRSRAKGQERALSNTDILIPTIVLDVIREDIEDYSKLYRHMDVRRVSGKARQIIAAGINEAVWTEQCANINEIAAGFYALEIDGYKVAGYIAVCNAVLEDSVIALGSEIIYQLIKGIGLALDKAILYGTGVKMPLGIVTRLTQTTAPSDYPAQARPWANLSTSNVKTIAAGKTGTELFAEIIAAFGAAKNGEGTPFWAMNHATRTKLMSSAVGVNASGAIVSGMNGSMPVIGGAIEELNFVPDNVIIGGYGRRYLVAEREGAAVDVSREVQFLEDNTVFRGKARYDGAPVIAEAFVAIGLEGTTPTATMTFAPDVANEDVSE